MIETRGCIAPNLRTVADEVTTGQLKRHFQTLSDEIRCTQWTDK